MNNPDLPVPKFSRSRLHELVSLLGLTVFASLLVFQGCTRSSQPVTQPNSLPETVSIERYCNAEVRAGEALVRFTNDKESQGTLDAQRLAEKIADDRLTTERVGNTDIVLVRSLTGRSAAALVDAFGSPSLSKVVARVEANYIIRLDSTVPNAFSGPDPIKQWGLEKIRARLAWQVDTDERANVVAVIDSGIDCQRTSSGTKCHEDLEANTWSSKPGFLVKLGSEVIRCPAGSFGFDATAAVSESDEMKCSPSESDYSHGTQVAGIIGAQANNGKGVAGVSPKTEVMSVKFTRNDSGCVSDLIRSLDFILEASKTVHIRVVNNSLGFSKDELYACHSTPKFLQEAYERLETADMLVVASNGNSNKDTSMEKHRHYPSGLQLSNIIAVLGTTEADMKSSESNYDSKAANLIGAPGADIWSTLPANNYGPSGGTSFAAPFVSGTAALVLSNTKKKCNKLSATDLRNVILDKADKVTTLRMHVKEGRRLNAERALTECG